MTLYVYDIRLKPYKRMTVMVDGADQVVSVQFLAPNRNVSLSEVVLVQGETDKHSISTKDFMTAAWGGGGVAVEVIGTAKEPNHYIVNLMGGDTVTMFIPVPVIRQILHNAQVRKEGRGKK